MTYIRGYNKLSMEDCSPLAGAGRKRTRTAYEYLVRAQPFKTTDPRDGIKANEFMTSFLSNDAHSNDATDCDWSFCIMPGVMTSLMKSYLVAVKTLHTCRYCSNLGQE